jgi:DNA-binding LacI/PurR family transcriptional regulator
MIDSSYAFDVSRAYDEWCARAGVDPMVARLSVTPTDAELSVTVRWIASGQEFDSLVFVAQGLAARSLAVLQSLGRRVGRDFHLGTLVGDPATELNNPEIHAVDLRPREFGHEVVILLHEIISGQASENDRRTHEAMLIRADAINAH